MSKLLTIQFRFLFIILILILLVPSTNNSIESGEDNVMVRAQTDSEMIPNQLINETESIPFLETNSDEIEVGNELTIFHGMKNDLDEFIEGYNFTLFLKTGEFNQSDLEYNIGTDQLLKKNTTKDFLEKFELSTFQGLTISLGPNNYTIVYLVNTTNRGLLNITKIFEVIVQPGANIKVEFALASSVDEFIDDTSMEINENKTFSIILINTGFGNAFNVSLEITGLNEPLGLANFTLPFFKPVFSSFSQVLNFSLAPSVYGIGRLQLELRYSDAQGDNKVSAFTFTVNVLPNFVGKIINSDEIVVDRDTNLVRMSVTLDVLNNSNLAPLILNLKIISPDIIFNPTEIQYRPGVQNYEFIGTVVEFGLTSIDFLLTIFDPTGADEEEISINSKTIEILTEPLPVPDKPLIDYLPIFSIVLYFIFIIFILVLYIQKDFRLKFFSKVLGMRIIEELKYGSEKIIIDGSNVAWEGTDKYGKPNLANIFQAVEVLKEQGFKDIKIIADAALRYQIHKKEELDVHTKSEKIKVVPAKVEADGFILRLAAEEGYMILSNDLFKEFRKTYTWIDNRRIPYSILEDKIYLHPVYDLELKENS